MAFNIKCKLSVSYRFIFFHMPILLLYIWLGDLTAFSNDVKLMWKQLITVLLFAPSALADTQGIHAFHWDLHSTSSVKYTLYNYTSSFYFPTDSVSILPAAKRNWCQVNIYIYIFIAQNDANKEVEFSSTTYFQFGYEDWLLSSLPPLSNCVPHLIFWKHLFFYFCSIFICILWILTGSILFVLV